MKRLFLVISMLCFLPAANVRAAPINWADRTYSHLSEEENLVDLLRDFCASQGVNVVISKKVEGTLSGRFEGYAPQAFLKHVATAYGLVWYYDGNSLYIYRSDELQSTMIGLEYVPVDRFRRVLEQLGIVDERYPLKGIDGERIVFVSGPERYVALAVKTAEMLDASEGKAVRSRRANEVVKVFPLKYAWADDQTFNFQDEDVTVPGVATILRNILSAQSSSGLTSGARSKQLPLALKKLKGEGLASKGKGEGGEQLAPPTAPKKEDESQTPAPEAAAEAFIQADTRLNAVIIRDIEQRMPYYEETIALLDVPVGLVQVQATIMDIGTQFSRELGVNWRFRTGGKNIDTKGGFNADEDFSIASDALGLGQGLNLATIIGDSAQYLLARVHALEEQGKARILSQPSVLTLNNVEALLESTSTFYVKVRGTYTTDLYNVSSGVVLKVTPHIIEEDDGTKIKLFVKIEDGEPSTEDDDQVDGLPVVTKSTLTTQAVIRENESLLIGGYYRKMEIESTTGVPCLANFPIFGPLFRDTENQNDDARRMFLISPKVITHEDYAAADREGVVEEETRQPTLEPERKALHPELETSEEKPITEKPEIPVPESDRPSEQPSPHPSPGPDRENGGDREGSPKEPDSPMAGKLAATEPVFDPDPRETGTGIQVEPNPPEGATDLPGDIPPETADSPSPARDMETGGAVSSESDSHRQKTLDATVETKEDYFGVQVGSFIKKKGALRTAETLEGKGHSPVICVLRDDGGRTWYTVFGGVFKDWAEAAFLANKIGKESGHPPLVTRIAPDTLEQKRIHY